MRGGSSDLLGIAGMRGFGDVQGDLFSGDGEVFDLPAPKSPCTATPIAPSDAGAFFVALKNEVEWRQDFIQMFGKGVALPRLNELEPLCSP
jgi:hypothetical protein